MIRIDSVNARANANGAGKAGFSDNADLSGQDATYLTPDWLNHIQEELANVLEKNGVALDLNNREQLFSLLATKADLAASSQVARIIGAAWINTSSNQIIFAKGVIAGYTNFGGGQHQITFATAQPDADYMVFGTISRRTGGNDVDAQSFILDRNRSQTYLVGSFRFVTYYGG